MFPKMIFVLGYGRSGTTMMGHILGNHPDVHMFQELNFFEKLWDRKQKGPLSVAEATDLIARLICINNHGFAILKDHSEYLEEGKRIIDGIAEKNITPVEVYEIFLKHTVQQYGKSIPCEQTPGYIYSLGEILKLFPTAKIINMIRDPRDVLVSWKKKWRQRTLRKEPTPFHVTFRTWIHYHPISRSLLWKAAVKVAQPYADDGRILQVKFEDLLSYPQREVQKACEFIGISYQDSMLDIPVVGSSFLKEQPEKKGIDQKRTANWQDGGLNSAELFINQRVAADIMKKYDYAPARVFPNPLLLLLYLITLPVKMFLSFVVHKKHFKNITEVIKNRITS